MFLFFFCITTTWHENYAYSLNFDDLQLLHSSTWWIQQRIIETTNFWKLQDREFVELEVPYNGQPNRPSSTPPMSPVVSIVPTKQATHLLRSCCGGRCGGRKKYEVRVKTFHVKPSVKLQHVSFNCTDTMDEQMTSTRKYYLVRDRKEFKGQSNLVCINSLIYPWAH